MLPQNMSERHTVGKVTLRQMVEVLLHLHGPAIALVTALTVLRNGSATQQELEGDFDQWKFINGDVSDQNLRRWVSTHPRADEDMRAAAQAAGNA